MSSQQYDVIVVGAGPSGSLAALTLARAGVRVLLLERGVYPGSKNVSGAAMYASALLNEVIPDFWQQAPVERYVGRRVLNILTETEALSLGFSAKDFAQPPYNAWTILRPRFDRWLAEQAVCAGATLITETVADDVLWNPSHQRVIGVKVRRPGGQIYAPIVIAAEGVNAFLTMKAGLRHPHTPHNMALGVKEVVTLDARLIDDRFHLVGQEGVVYEYLGGLGGVHGGAFIYTNRDSLSIGVIVQIGSLIETSQPPYVLLERFKQHPAVMPLLRGAVLKEYSAHMIPEGGYRHIGKVARDGFMVVGDAAGLVLSAGLYLEGINFAMASGIAAAQTAIAALGKNDVSLKVLSGYRRLLERSFVMKDLRQYKNASEQLMGRHLQETYPDIVTSIFRDAFTIRPLPRRKIFRIVRTEARRRKVGALTAIRDAWRMTRTFGG